MISEVSFSALGVTKVLSMGISAIFSESGAFGGILDTFGLFSALLSNLSDFHGDSWGIPGERTGQIGGSRVPPS